MTEPRPDDPLRAALAVIQRRRSEAFAVITASETDGDADGAEQWKTRYAALDECLGLILTALTPQPSTPATAAALPSSPTLNGAFA